MRHFLFAAILVLLPALGVAQGVSSVPPACTGSGKCRVALTAPSYTSSAGNGVVGFACATNGCRIDLGTGADDYLYSGGAYIATPASFNSPALTTTGATGVVASGAGNTLNLRGAAADAGGAVGVRLGNTTTLTNATAKPVQVCADTPATCASPVAWVYADGTIGSTNEQIIIPWWFNAAAATGSCPATGTGCAGHTVGAHPVIITAVTGYVSVVGGGGAGNTVLTITDGTNTCTATFACASVTNSTGTKRVATANGAGTGCVYAANAALSAYVSTAGCTTTQPTFRNIDIVGKQQ